MSEGVYIQLTLVFSYTFADEKAAVYAFGSLRLVIIDPNDCV